MVNTYFTPLTFAAAIERFGKQLDRPIINGMRRGLRFVRTRAVKDFKTRGIGRTVFGGKRAKGKKDGARIIIKNTRVVKHVTSWRGGLTVTGLAALQEKGGKTKPHFIGSKGKLLSNGPGGKFLARGPVKHPGSQIAKIPFLQDAMSRGESRIAREIDKGIIAEITKILGAGSAAA